jgi:hypothetical protein
MANIGSTNISFSGLKAAYVAGGRTDASGNNSLRDGQTNTSISLSFFRNAGLTDGTSIPSSGEISINDDFKDKTFGNKIITTDKFRAYTDWSGHSYSLKGEAGSSTYTGSTTANKRVRLYNTGQSPSYPYPILLLSPSTNSSDTPGIIVDRSNNDVVDEATVWFRVINHNGYNLVQFGIVAKDMTTDDWEDQLDDLGGKHATYCDRLCFHGLGFHNYAGSRDDITSSSTIVSPQYKSGTYGSYLTTYFHTRTGKSAGTQRSNNAASAPGLGTNAYFFKSNLSNYSTYRGNTTYPNHGLKLKWYETTIQASLVNGSNVIQPVSPPSTWSSGDLTDVFSGMYVSGTGISSSAGAFIGEVHTNYMVMYKQKGSSTTSLVNSEAYSDQSNVTLTISGYLYWTLVTTPDSADSNTNYVDAKILGPPHQVLPKYQASTSTSTPAVEITEWSFFIGDTTSGTSNSFNYDLRDQEPGGTAFSYSVSYSSGTVPSNESFTYSWKYYAFGSSIGTTYLYWYSGSTLNLLRSISGQQHTSSGKTWNSYTEDLSSYSGQTGYIVYAYKTGNFWRNDPQFDEMSIEIAGSTTDLAPDSGLWARNTSYTTSLSYPSSNWNNTISTSTSANNRWNLDSGGTPSSSTGTTKDASGSTTGKYLYFEGSSPNYSSSNRYYWFRSKNQFTLSSGG